MSFSVGRWWWWMWFVGFLSTRSPLRLTHHLWFLSFIGTTAASSAFVPNISLNYTSICTTPYSTCLCTSNDSTTAIDCSGRSLTSWPWVRRPNVSSPSFRVDTVNISRNHLTQWRVDNVMDFVDLKTLDLSYNSRLNIEADSQWQTPSLENLFLESCGLVSVPSLNGLRNLIYLNLRLNSIGFVSSRNFRPVQRTLRALDIGQNALVSFPSDAFSVNSSLRILNISQNLLSSLHKYNFRNLTLLEALNLRHNTIRRVPKDVFAPLVRLKELNLDYNRLRRLEGLSFKGLKELQTLTLDRNRLFSLADGAFWDLPMLTRLTLSANRLTGIDRGWVYGLNALTLMNLSSNAIGRFDVDAWQFALRLQVLDLSSNRLTTLRPKSFHHLRQLRHLHLRDNHLSMIYANAFESLGELVTLDLSLNMLADVLISGQQIFLPLRNLRTLDLASNEIRVLPAGVFDGLRFLSTLDLSNNPLVVFSVNALPLPSSLKLVTLNTTSLLCDCQLTWLINYGAVDDDPNYVDDNTVASSGNRLIVGTAECRHPPAWSGKALVDLPANVSCGTWPRPLIVSNPHSTTGLRGQNVSFECRAHCQEDYSDCHMSIHWRKNGRIMYNEPDSGLTIVALAEEDGSSRWFSRLTIEAVDDTDSGWYQCQFANDLASVLSEKAQLTVLVPPSLIKRPVDVAVRIGGTVRLECAAAGNPPPTLSWKKDNSGDDFPAARERRMHLMPTDDVFFIVDVKLQDAGIYSCVAKSPAGEDRAQARLNVYSFDEDGPGGTVGVVVPELTVRVGATAVLECQESIPRNQGVGDDGEADDADENAVVEEFRWTRNGLPLASSAKSYRAGEGRVWIIKDASVADQGIYNCRSTTSDGAVSERSWRLIVVGTLDETAKLGSPPANPAVPSLSSGSSDLDKRTNDGSHGFRPSPPSTPSTVSGQSFFGPSGMPGVLVVVIIACVVLTSLVWVLVIFWRRRRSSGSGGVATVVVSLHENTSVPSTLPYDGHGPLFGTSPVASALGTQASLQSTSVAF